MPLRQTFQVTRAHYRSFEEDKVMHVPNEEQIAEAKKRFRSTLGGILP